MIVCMNAPHKDGRQGNEKKLCGEAERKRKVGIGVKCGPRGGGELGTETGDDR